MTQVNDPGPVPGQGKVITEIYAWTVISPKHGTEGIAALEKPIALPLVATNRTTMEKMKPFVQKLATEIGAPLRLRRFVEAYDEHDGAVDNVLDVVEP